MKLKLKYLPLNLFIFFLACKQTSAPSREVTIIILSDFDKETPASFGFANQDYFHAVEGAVLSKIESPDSSDEEIAAIAARICATTTRNDDDDRKLGVIIREFVDANEKTVEILRKLGWKCVAIDTTTHGSEYVENNLKILLYIDDEFVSSRYGQIYLKNRSADHYFCISRATGKMLKYDIKFDEDRYVLHIR